MKKDMSNDFSLSGHEISQDKYAILPLTEMAKRETAGKRLKTARLALGLSADRLAENIKQDYRAETSASTIRDIEADKSPNPGVKTLEFISKGVGLKPADVIALIMDDPPDVPEAGYAEGQFALMGKAYKQIRKDKKPVADELIKMLVDKMNEWR